ncbi:MAG: carbon starvation CstA family protein [Bacteroidales bacterium]|nr:carbon starvation CstA family protein [Bacteroidales bacterium]
MITFLVAIALLLIGYAVYGKIAEKIIAPSAERKTPAYTMQDGVDYIPMPTWKIFMIQFLNIAGLGPIFGAVLGAKFGVSAYLWIVIGCIFIGSVHDYLSGMMSLRMNGANLPDIVGKFLGDKTKLVMRIFTVVLMVMVGAVFVSGPAAILDKITPDFLNANFWIAVIFIYYVIATLLPIDAIIGKIYPIFAIALIFMALGVFCMLVFGGYGASLPEITEGLQNTHPKASSTPIFPIMCITIACGAISGFHATQSPLMARCLKNETLGRRVFYGSMILEGVMALIWAAAAIWYYQENGLEESNASLIVDFITNTFLGKLGAILALLGVVFAPITSGDTALRSCRLILADFLKLNQKQVSKRLMISIPLFLACAGVIIYSLSDKDGFNIIWRYFGWSNQALAVFTLWSITVYLHQEKRQWLITFIPAVFMTLVCATYLFIAPECFALNHTLSYIIGTLLTLICTATFIIKMNKKK